VAFDFHTEAFVPLLVFTSLWVRVSSTQRHSV
jgi:uncharacterized membrane protein